MCIRDRSLEELPVALEKVLQGGDQQRLAKATRARQEDKGSRVDQPVNLLGLVNVKKIALAQAVKKLDADR